MSKTWTFIGGMIAGVVSVFATAAVAVAREEKQRTDVVLGENNESALPDVEAEKHDTANAVIQTH